ncbi:MAG: Unknown protein [uncultured Sulfurovum sp.]|uniref:SPOR domain-containing protein n=1 Tax=uncultured Sulfurovum sp. TaxID=269237 RepID=A0A6S6TRG2_9BACT|nr:MAG: Unknown protein [uncultured Sulfurovum sp.]
MLQNYKPVVYLILLLSFSHLQATQFIIKLASYSKKESAISQISLLDKAINQKISIAQENSLHKIYSLPFSNKEDAQKVLPLYKKVFIDAYIMVYVPTKNLSKPVLNSQYTTIDNNETNKSNTVTKPSLPFVITKKDYLLTPNSRSVQDLTDKDIFRNKTFYVCPDRIQTSSEKLLIESKFTDINVTYNPIIGNLPSITLKYILHKKRLYFLKGSMINPNQYRKIEKKLFEYILVSHYSNKKKLTTMRYYYKKEDAISYLSSLRIH